MWVSVGTVEKVLGLSFFFFFFFESHMFHLRIQPMIDECIVMNLIGDTTLLYCIEQKGLFFT